MRFAQAILIGGAAFVLVSCQGGSTDPHGTSVFTSTAPLKPTLSPDDFSQVVGAVTVDPRCVLDSPPCSSGPSRVVITSIRLSGPIEKTVLSRGDFGFTALIPPGDYMLTVVGPRARGWTCPAPSVDVPAASKVTMYIICVD
jgi:hypothetical protein